MLVVDVFCRGALMLCWTGLCVVLQVLHGQPLVPALDPSTTGDRRTPGDVVEVTNAEHDLRSAKVPGHGPCFVDDIYAALRESAGNGGEVTNSTLTMFGICQESSSGLLELANEMSKNQGHVLEVLHPVEVFLVEGEDRETLKLTFDLPRSPSFKLKPVLLLAFESLPTGEDLEVTFSGQSLDPDTQSACITGETQYMTLTGRVSEGNVHQRWVISVQTKSPDMKQRLLDILHGGKSGSEIGMSILLLFLGQRGTHSRYTPQAPLQTSSFLCELKRFLGAVMPRGRPDSPPLRLDSLRSEPPLTLGPSSSETVLAALINSSATTVFSFAGWGSSSRGPRGELDLSPALLEELKDRLEQTAVQVMDVLAEKDVDHRAAVRLGRLRELSAFPEKEPTAGENQYRAFLLLKAVQTVARAYETQRGLRATRAGPDVPPRASVCGLRSLTVNLEWHLVGPNTANINNCHGSCAFPLVVANNHAVLLSQHIGAGGAAERAPCCVPVNYEALEVVDLNEEGTYLSIKPDMVARECGCR